VLLSCRSYPIGPSILSRHSMATHHPPPYLPAHHPLYHPKISQEQIPTSISQQPQPLHTLLLLRVYGYTKKSGARRANTFISFNLNHKKQPLRAAKHTSILTIQKAWVIFGNVLHLSTFILFKITNLYALSSPQYRKHALAALATGRFPRPHHNLDSEQQNFRCARFALAALALPHTIICAHEILFPGPA